MITLNYQIALTNVPFDNSYKNVMRFDTRSEQETFFNVSSLFSSETPKVNFNVSSLMATNIVFDCAKTDNINELLNKNYCIVKDNSSNAGLDYYYYFITNAKQENENRISLSIELDIFQTYYIDLKFSDCLIERASLDRWVDNIDGTVNFNGNVDSPLFEREPIKNVAKRMTKRTSLDIYNTGNVTIDNWLNENVLCWEYIYLDPDHTYDLYNADGNQDPLSTQFNKIYYGTFESDPILSNDSSFDINYLSQMACICIPIFKDRTENVIPRLILQDDTYPFNTQVGRHYVILSNSGLQGFLNKNLGNQYIYAIKLSYTPPFNNFKYYTDYEIISDNNNNSLILKKSNPQMPYVQADCGKAFATVGTSRHGILNVNTQYGISKILKPKPYTITPELKFNISEIINSNKNAKFNPKLLSSDYFNLKISDATENGFNYDIQKLNQKNLNIQSIEALTPDMSKRYISILSEGGVYIPENSENLIGFIGNNDSTLILATDAYKTMLANNKNFFLQNSINRALNVVSGGISSVGSALTGNISQAISGAINTGINYARDKITEDLTVDNLKNAPESIQSAKGNIVFEFMYSKNGIIVEEWDILPHEKEMINDYMCMYGFSYNKIGNIKNFDNIRKYYNFIKADIEEVSSDTLNVSDNVLQKFKRLFAQGVRFWNTDIFSYTKENYENWLQQAIQNRFIAVFHTLTSDQHYYINYKNKTFKAEYGTNKNIALDKASGTFTVSCDSNYGIIVRPITINTDAQYTMTRIDAQTIQFDYTNATYLDIYAEIEPI